MVSKPAGLQTRLTALRAALPADLNKTVAHALQTAKGDWPAARLALKAELPDDQLKKADFAHALSVATGDDAAAVSAIAASGAGSMRELAANFDVDQLSGMLAPKGAPAGTDETKAKARELNTKLFAAETSGVIERMARTAELPIADAKLREGVADFLAAKPDFDIRSTSVLTALSEPGALDHVAIQDQPGVVAQLKTIQRVQALSPTPEAMPVLMKANMTSAFHISELPQSTFVARYGDALGTATAEQVHTNATNARMRNEHALMSMHETARGSGLRVLDGGETTDERIMKMQKVADDHAVPLNLETLFGSMDYCACDDCSSVYSPSAYFVELMQYLRNNDLGPDPAADDPNPADNPDIHPGFAGTPLEMLYRRRPDIFCLDLTCENTYTVLPYIDLVNEVMESFLVNLGKYHADANDPKQATLDVFNTTDETTGELLAVPQHVNYEAYCILKSAVYPFTLPYHQPIDAARIFLGYMGTSRFELLDTYRTASETGGGVALTPQQQDELRQLHAAVLDRSADAEFLGLTQEEYIILTHEAFWPKSYFELTQQQALTDDAYHQKIGVKQVHEYYGYGSEAEMLSLDEAEKKGLTFVKKQFLPRTGIQYTDLVELLKARTINPNFPQGKALTLMEGLRFSYRFMQTLVDYGSPDPKVRFGKLIALLQAVQPWLPLIEALLHPDPCHQKKADCCSQEQTAKDLERWVYCYFERVGKLIVLEAGEGPTLSVSGGLYSPVGGKPEKFGRLDPDGDIFDLDEKQIGRVQADLSVVDMDGKPFSQSGHGDEIWVADEDAGKLCGIIFHDVLHSYGYNRDVAHWLPPRDTCDLDKVRLIHLDGTPVTAEEYDRMQRFIRLWRKMGWSIDETDKALDGFVEAPNGGGGDAPAFVGFDEFSDDCSANPDGGDEEDCGCDDEELPCPGEAMLNFDITPAFLHDLAAIKKMLDLTGLPLLKLLAFWADISTAGEKSLYAKLFLTHNIVGLDKVFVADANGNYLTKPAKITDHVPVLMAALGLKAGDVQAIMALRNIADSLTLKNVSALYRHGLLAKLIHVRCADLGEVFALFGDPFTSAAAACDLLENWGKMEDAGFTFKQLDYVVRGVDDPLRPLAPSQTKVLQLTKTLYDGLNAIDKDHPDADPTKPDTITDDLVRAKAGLVYDQGTVEDIVGLLDGTTIHSTNAPVNLVFVIPAQLAAKLKYSNQPDAVPPTAILQVTGLFTDAEATLAKSLAPASAEWGKAIDRVAKQALNFFNDTLYGIFADADAARANLLAGDVIVPADQIDFDQPDPNTAPGKRLYFLKYFIPFLRERLARRFVVDTISGAAGLAQDTTDTLLADILKVGAPPQSALSALEAVKSAPQADPTHWKGYLIPSATDAFTFVATSALQPAPLMLDGQAIAFPHQQDDPSNVWSSDPVPLKAGKLYWLQVDGMALAQLQWKTALAPKTAIPASALLPDDSAQGTGEAFAKVYKSAIVINGLSLSADEVAYLQAHQADFDGLDFNAPTMQQVKRLEAYAALRDSLPKRDTTLLDLFAWAVSPDDPAQLGAHIAAATAWDQTSVEHLVAPGHFDVASPAAFRNEIDLVKIQKALAIASKTGMDVDSLFGWAGPSSQFWHCHKIAEDIKKALRARYDEEDWELVVRPLNDQLRENQKQALIAYLLVQQDLIDWGAVDADSLFEFFLIDVQMCACMETSRMKQAISTVQLFIQRCMLGLEAPDVPNDALDRGRWEWMQKYRVWEANRKVFLYPENWIKPELRDDKSPFYKELESELLQKDINTQTVQDALQNYLFKVDEVANLCIVGIHMETGDGGVQLKLHIFGRTRNAPYLFYYRYYDAVEDNWYPWEKMQVDIPTYDIEDANMHVTGHGTYLVPVVWNGRLLVFFPQFAKKTRPKKSGDSAQISQPYPFWDIKLGWTEYRNRKWTQKQLCADSYADDNNQAEPVPPNDVLPIEAFQFVPRLIDGATPEVAIDLYSGQLDTAKARFVFSGSQLFLDSAVPPAIGAADRTATKFHFTDNATQMHSLQAVGAGDPPLFRSTPYFDVESKSVTVLGEGGASSFNHTFVHELVGKLAAGDIDDLYAYYGAIADQPTKDDAYGADSDAGYHELRRPYALYNWEIGLHAPMAMVGKLLDGQQFDQALDMCHYVFDPAAPGFDGKRFWQFPPFKEIDAENVLENLFLSLKPGTPDKAINEWRSNPFQPHVVARARPSAYMKWVVMQYIRVLIAYGDYYFRQNSLETIPMAIQCYVLASHIYGPRGQVIPKRGKVLPQTYLSLLDKWDAFGNAMVELELAFPFSNQTSLPIGGADGVIGLANVFGFATSLYFCIPPNPNLQDLRTTIDDRLFKIRHCEDIDGVFRPLPLFDPPIDPGLLVDAAAAGLSISSVLNDLNSPMPNYRFNYLLQKALELCGELKSLGSLFLSSKEKKDSEALSKLRAKHEVDINTRVMEVRKKQLEEANASLVALQESRKAPVYRLQHALKLIGEDLAKVPDEAADFSEIPDTIETPVDDSGLKLISFEKEELDKASAAADWQIGIGIVETLASVFHALPTMHVDGHPLGVGADVAWGFPNLANATQAVGRGLKIYADNLQFQSTRAGRKGGFLRQLQDRVQQANSAGHEIKSIDKQILTQQIRIALADQEISNQQKQIDNSQEVSDFLSSKYSSEELYDWMQQQLRGLYYQTYTQAYDLAKRAEKVFRFERGMSETSFVQFGYWDPGHDGLLAGERLHLALKQLEAAYQEKRGYDFEISKSVSLRQVNPLALLELRETGTCEFTVPEMLYDMDHPGHYMRRIKSVAVTLPCIVGPHTGVNCTLRLMEHKFRTSAMIKDKNDYPEHTDEADERFSTQSVPIAAIAVSSGQNDSGVFDLNFRDERYIPFEGAGAISKWRLELPADFRQFDYDTIADVVLHIRYTAIDGGDRLKVPAAGAVQAYIKSVEELSRDQGLFAAFDLRHDFPNEWYKATQALGDPGGPSVALADIYERLPVFTKGHKPAKIQATDIYIIAGADSGLTGVKVTQNGDDTDLGPGPALGDLKSFDAKDLDGVAMDDWTLTFQGAAMNLDTLWLVARYTLG